ncbi:MAG: MarR family transcriptional regulator [Lachnospiraceae bacterium]|nr:MarR family transcriptional regulator [Lachnospiraceae bacterium]MBP3736029.1 MarR family transcriptional regulator [Lachnospiraceae bacterium]
MQTEKKEGKYACLQLDHQLCFPLYAASKEIIRRYKPFLDELDLTYTQYITMMVLWEKKQLNVKELGKCLFLDSGTLTPVLKKLAAKGYIQRTRSKEDERNLLVSITPEGDELKKRAVRIPQQMSACIDLSAEEALVLNKLLNKLTDNLQES